MADAADGLDDNESELYDRQIRLWGVEAQRRMRNSRILYAGFAGVCAEAAKNLVLAGMHATIQDSQLVVPEDLGTNFFLTYDSIGKNRALASMENVQRLNSLVEVHAEQCPLESLPDDYFHKFTCICLSRATLKQQKRINSICRDMGIFLFLAETFGHYGFIFVDLGPKFSYRKETGTNKALGNLISLPFPSVEQSMNASLSSLKDRWGHVHKAYVYVRVLLLFEDVHNRRPTLEDKTLLGSTAKKVLHANGMPEDFFSDSDIDFLSSQAHAEINPVCAILGGILGQEMIKALSQNGVPTHNVFIFDAHISEGKVFLVPSKYSA